MAQKLQHYLHQASRDHLSATALQGWHLSATHKPRRYLLEIAEEAEPQDFQDLIINQSGQRQLFNTITEGQGVIVLTGMSQSLAAKLAKLLAAAYDSPNYHLLSIADEQHLDTTEGQKIKQPDWSSLKHWDADVIFLNTEDSINHLSDFWPLGHRSLIIVHWPAANSGQAAKQLYNTLKNERLQPKYLKQIISAKSASVTCPTCRAPFALAPDLAIEHATWLGVEPEVLVGNTFFYGQGCLACRHTGHLGQRLIVEVADYSHTPATSQDWQALHQDPPHQTWQELALNASLAGAFSLDELKKLFN
jgi:hypothetical protein